MKLALNSIINYFWPHFSVFIFLLRLLIFSNLSPFLAVLGVQRYCENWKNSHSRCYSFDSRTRIRWLCYSFLKYAVYSETIMFVLHKWKSHAISKFGTYDCRLSMGLIGSHALYLASIRFGKMISLEDVLSCPLFSLISNLLEMFGQLAQGGTAVGTGLNTKKGYISFLTLFTSHGSTPLSLTVVCW